MPYKFSARLVMRCFTWCCCSPNESEEISMQASYEVPVAPKYSEMDAEPTPVTVARMASLHRRERARCLDTYEVAGSAVPRAPRGHQHGDVQDKLGQGNIISPARPLSPHSDITPSVAAGENFGKHKFMLKNRFFQSYAGIFMESSAIWKQVNQEFGSRLSVVDFEKRVHALKMIEHFAIPCPLDYFAQGNEKIILYKQQSSSETLAGLLEKGAGLPWSTRLHTAASAASGLRCLHKSCLVFWDNQVRKQTGGAIYWIPNSEDIHLSKVEIYLSGVGESHLIPAKILPKALARKFYLSSYSGTGKANVSIFLHYCSMVLVISSCQHQDNIGLQQSLLPPALKMRMNAMTLVSEMKSILSFPSFFEELDPSLKHSFQVHPTSKSVLSVAALARKCLHASSLYRPTISEATRSLWELYDKVGDESDFEQQSQDGWDPDFGRKDKQESHPRSSHGSDGNAEASGSVSEAQEGIGRQGPSSSVPLKGEADDTSRYCRSLDPSFSSESSKHFTQILMNELEVLSRTSRGTFGKLIQTKICMASDLDEVGDSSVRLTSEIANGRLFRSHSLGDIIASSSVAELSKNTYSESEPHFQGNPVLGDKLRRQTEWATEGQVYSGPVSRYDSRSNRISTLLLDLL